MTQADAVQVEVAWAKSQAIPHPPQFLESVVSTSHPSAGSLSQSANPRVHAAIVQADSLHPAVA